MVRKFAGMNVHYISRKCGKGVWCYAEKGAESSNFDLNNNKYPTLVFIHGFGGDKVHYFSHDLKTDLDIKNLFFLIN